jgi:hypothetical protein
MFVPASWPTNSYIDVVGYYLQDCYDAMTAVIALQPMFNSRMSSVERSDFESYCRSIMTIDQQNALLVPLGYMAIDIDE